MAGDFHLDENALLNFVRESDGFKQLQQDVNRRMQDAIREVNTAYHGKPAPDVDVALREQFSALGIEPTEPGFTDTVNAISNNQLRN